MGRTCGALLTRMSVLLVVLLSHDRAADSAFEFKPLGAQAGGLGDAFSAMCDGADAVLWNPASVAGAGGLSFASGLDRAFGLVELDTHSLAVAWCGGRIGIGLGVTGFGFEAYGERSLRTVVAWRVTDRARLGAGVRWLAMDLGDAPRRRWAAFDLGSDVAVTRTSRLSFWAWNAGGTATKHIGQGGAMGLSFEPADRIRISAEVSKEAGHPTGLGIGIAYRPFGKVALRGGVGGRPERLSIGIGLPKGIWRVDYAAVHHTILGLSHRVSVGGWFSR